jgi:hypothetical protein
MSNLIVDVWQDFDFATLNAANLDAHDHFATTGLWSVIANTHGVMDAAAEQLLKGKINTSLDDISGTTGWSIDCNFAGGTSAINFTLVGTGGPGSKNVVSCAFWFRMPPAWAGSFREQDLIRLKNVLGQKQLYIKASDHGDVGGQPKMFLFNETDGYAVSDCILTAGSFYFGTCYYGGLAVSDSLKARVYDVSGVQVGSELVSPGIAQPVTDIDFGPIVGASGAFVGNLYLDDLLIDWTNHAWPLGPGTLSVPSNNKLMMMKVG